MATSPSSRASVPPLPGSLGRDLRRDLRALWLVRSRVVFTDIAFWLVLLGYDVRERRFTNPLYTLYAVVFFLLWGFMVLLLLADVASDLLLSLPLGSPAGAAVALGAGGFLSFFLAQLHRAAGRSPFAFSEEDAWLLCMTPLDRRIVALFWLIEGWVTRGVAVWALAVVAGYALVQAQSPVELTPSDLPLYLLAGLRAFSISLPLSLGLLGLAWAAGAWRLHGQRPRAHLRWVALVLVLILVGVGLVGPQWGVLTGFAPLAFPVRAGLGLAPWGLGMGVVILLAAAGAGALWFLSRDMSLSRAAQETNDRQAAQAGLLQPDLGGDLRLKRRLGAGSAPSRLPAGPGLRSFFWKEAVQSVRRLQWSTPLPWLAVFALNLGLLAFSAWTTRVWMAVVWVLLALHLAEQPLRRNLGRWWLLRQLPFPTGRLVLAMLAQPLAALWLLGIAALPIAGLLGYTIPVFAAPLYLAAVPVVALSGAVDLLRQARIGQLLVGVTPFPSFLGALLSLVLVAALVGLSILLVSAWGFLPFAAAGLTIIAGVLVADVLWHAAAALLRGIR